MPFASITPRTLRASASEWNVRPLGLTAPASRHGTFHFTCLPLGGLPVLGMRSIDAMTEPSFVVRGGAPLMLTGTFRVLAVS